MSGCVPGAAVGLPGGVPHFSGAVRWVGIAPFRPQKYADNRPPDA